MAYAAPDAAQNGTPALTNGDSRQNGHNGHAQPNGLSNPGSHGDDYIPAVTMDGGRTARPDKGKEPEQFVQAMEIDGPDIDEPDSRPEPFSLDFGLEVHHPDLDNSHAADPNRAATLMASVDENEEPDWDAIEDNWTSEMQAIHDEEDAALDLALKTEEKPLKEQCEKAVDNYNRIYQDLLQARIEIDGLVANRECIFARYDRIQIDRDNQRAANDLRVRSWIAKGRREAAEAAARRREEAHKRRSAYVRDAEHSMPAIFNERLRGLIEHDGQNNNGRSSSRQRSAEQSTSTHAQNGGPISLEGLPWDGTHPGFEPKRITDVTSATGVKVGVLLSIPLVNHWIDSLMRFPVLRDVVIRLGRKFTPAHLLAIYQGPDQKQSKWLSFMIQATGQQQDTACQTCAKGQGLFSACIIVGGPDFPRCGNCEWNKHGCHGAVGQTNAILPDFHGQARSQNRPRTDEAEGTKVTPVNKTPVIVKPAHFNYKKSVARFTKAMKLAEPPKPPAPSPAVIDLEQPNQSPATGPKTDKPTKTGKNGSAPARGNGRRQKPHNSTAGNKRPSTPNNGDQSFSKDMSPFDATEEITEDTLALRHDNMVYLAPELMAGVPRRKISPDHAYWDPSWKSLETYVQNKHDEWVSKVTVLKAIPEANLTDKDRTAIFQAGRQINRGKTVLKYLANCDSHPYQLVAKSFLTTSSTHYDTLYRMVATIEELGKFRLSVTPVDWLRQRLYEIHREKGDAFKLDKVLAKLYHDPKLSYLRSKNGFGNIGRPSVFTRGANGVEGSGGDGTQSSVSKRRSEKRRQQPESTTSTPTRRAFNEADQPEAADPGPRNKRRKKTPDPATAAATAALAPASVTASKRASRPAITSQAPKTSGRNGTLPTAIPSRVISVSPGPFASNVSENGSALSTPASSRASRAASRDNRRVVGGTDGSRPASRNIGQLDGADDSMDISHDTSRESGAMDSQTGPIESHHISHNYGGYTSSEDDDNDDNDSDAAPRGRNRTRNGARSNSHNANANRRSRARRTSRATTNEELDLDYSGYTSRDSLTNDVVVNKDWRVLQVKTRELTSNGHTTQYWHWVDEQHAHQTSGPGGPSDFDPMFEHQVLKETEPATSWGVFREPINFHLRLRELTGIRYATGSKIIAIGTKTMPDFEHRGDVFALFKRERTKRRFLVFMKKKGVALHKVSKEEIDRDWASLSESQLMPGNESD